MKIAMPVFNKSMESGIAESFGRTPYFLIYDTEAKTSAFFDNTAIASQGGAGIKAAQAVVDSGVSAVVVPQCGENAANVLKEAGIKDLQNHQHVGPGKYRRICRRKTIVAGKYPRRFSQSWRKIA
jgi:predicted Fe-Mo cluster-binding NifX family protein